ncbi:peptidoglycan-binding domain-containing protein [Peribacillus frigoritolerans]|nr:peptidoglycan-binding domain-containing protein [Peribacillus frigoritolerans]
MGHLEKNTETAVKKFQKSKELTSDGIVGPKNKKSTRT